MSYTIHLGKSLARARAADPDISLTYELHRSIFESEPDANLFELTLFYNMSDYYQDATFLDQAVVGLRTDVEEARRRLHNPRATEPLSALSKVCERASRKGMSVYAFGGK